jgi:hypothetical protein
MRTESRGKFSDEIAALTANASPASDVDGLRRNIIPGTTEISPAPVACAPRLEKQAESVRPLRRLKPER